MRSFVDSDFRTRPPVKPYPDFPLTAHKSGAWLKKLKGKIHYFGRWGRQVDGKLERLPGDDWWKPSLQLFQAQVDDLQAGRDPTTTGDGVLTVMDLCNRFLTAKTRRLNSGELTARTFAEYRQTTDRLLREFGKKTAVEKLAARDFEELRDSIAQQWGPIRLGNEITRVKSVFKYAFDNALIDRPVRYGSEFKKPGKAVLRKNKAEGGKKVFTADEIRRLLDTAPSTLRAMILLGVNCGFGNTDVANLQRSHIDLDAGWIDFPRPKTGIERRCPLWPETIQALQKSIAEIRKPKSAADSDCVFLTKRGNRWVKPSSKGRTDTVTLEFGKLLRKLNINGRRNLGFYSLRHTFRTVADGAKDQVAANILMGHADGSMAGNYRHGVDNDRLKEVAEYVRRWLFDLRPQPQVAISRRTPDVIVDIEFDSRGKRSQKQFTDPVKARTFFVRKQVEDKNPTVDVKTNDQPQTENLG